MKNIMKTLIFSFLVIFMTIGITSCENQETSDPTPQYSLEDFLGTWKSTSVVYDGKTFTDPCDKNWPTAITYLRSIELKVKNGLQDSGINYGECIIDPTNEPKVQLKTISNTMIVNFNSLNNQLSFEDTYIFLVTDFTPTLFKGKLIQSHSSGGHNNTVPADGIYTFVKI